MAKTRVPFGTRVRTSRQILRESLAFLGRERDLWWFPVLSTLVFGVFLASLVWAVAGGFQPAEADLGDWRPYAVVFGLLLLVGIPLTFLMGLLNTALAYAVWGRMEGRRTTKRAAWARALAHAGVIFRFNVIAGVVGVLIGVLGVFLEKLRFLPGVGQIAQLVGGAGWALASYFVVPVIAIEREQRAVGALRRSVSLVRKELGSSVSGFVTIQLALMMVFIPFSLLLAGAAGYLVYQGTGGDAEAFGTVWPPVLAACLGATLLLVWILREALNTTYQTALYRFAVTHRISEPFTVGTLHTAWEPYRRQ